MSLGLPDIGTGSLYYSQYDSDIVALLTRLQDNNSNVILAKDVRDPVWTLWNKILTVASQSLTQSSLFTLGTPSTMTVGGILEGSTFSNADLQTLFEQLLLAYVEPTITLEPTISELQFGQLTGIGLSYSIDVGSSPLSSLNYTGPWLPISSDIPTGSDPETGLKSVGNPTYSNTVSLYQANTWTMSVVTGDGLTFSSTASLLYKHKLYFGNITIPGGFTSSSPSSIVAVGSYLTDTRIKGLSYSQLSLSPNISQIVNFSGSGQYFVFASPTVMGYNFPFGFFVDNIFSQGFTKVRSSSLFSNEYSYQAPYDVYISNYPLYEGALISNTPLVTGATDSIYLVIDGADGSAGPTGPAVNGPTNSVSIFDGMSTITSSSWFIDGKSLYYGVTNSSFYSNQNFVIQDDIIGVRLKGTTQSIEFGETNPTTVTNAVGFFELSAYGGFTFKSNTVPILSSAAGFGLGVNGADPFTSFRVNFTGANNLLGIYDNSSVLRLNISAGGIQTTNTSLRETNISNINTASYSVLTTDYILNVGTSSELFLPPASLGQTYWVYGLSNGVTMSTTYSYVKTGGATYSSFNITSGGLIIRSLDATNWDILLLI